MPGEGKEILYAWNNPRLNIWYNPRTSEHIHPLLGESTEIPPLLVKNHPDRSRKTQIRSIGRPERQAETFSALAELYISIVLDSQGDSILHSDNTLKKLNRDTHPPKLPFRHYEFRHSQSDIRNYYSQQPIYEYWQRISTTLGHLTSFC